MEKEVHESTVYLCWSAFVQVTVVVYALSHLLLSDAVLPTILSVPVKNTSTLTNTSQAL